jgi:valyl-tRNA synthetase
MLYSIDTPPRYVSGPLHIGHATSYSQIDFVARYKRMRGFDVFFPLCVDANGLPIEVELEKMHGVDPKEVGRKKFNEMCRRFAEQNAKKVIDQYKALSISMDDSLYYRTDSPEYRRITQITFIDLFKRGLIYRDRRPVNWCPRCKTSLADAELEYRQRKNGLNYITFRLEGGDVTIATTRPELLFACKLLAFHPGDERYKGLERKSALTPFGKWVKIVKDGSVDPDFGSGMVMICTIGDREDLRWVRKYRLEIDRAIDEEGKMTSLCGEYEGLTVEEARSAVLEDLEEKGLIVKGEKIDQNVAVCWRCHTPIEFLVEDQWFLKTIAFKREMEKVADEMDFYPDFMRVRLKEWISSLEWDWPISRMRYYATPLPIWYCENCPHVVVAEKGQCYVDPTLDPPPVDRCPRCGGPLRGSEEVFDTWMDSSVTPLVNRENGANYPMSLRPQSHDIIRTWLYYTSLRCYLATGEKPFDSVMISGFILAPDGRPMHASWGNAIDPMEVIERYGSDCLRYFAANCALGVDTPFRWNDVKRGAKFLQKLRNVVKFITIARSNFESRSEAVELRAIDRWALTWLSEIVERVTTSMEKLDFQHAIREVESFLWHTFADDYIEMAKYRIYKDVDGVDKEGAIYALTTIGKDVLKMLHPFLPSITRELYAQIDPEGSIISWPEPQARYPESFASGERARSLISALRGLKSSMSLPLSSELSSVTVYVGRDEELADFYDEIKATIHVKKLIFTTSPPQESAKLAGSYQVVIDN